MGYGIPSGFAEYTHTARYMVRNPNQQTVTPVSGWNSYDGTGVTVTVASYAKDIPNSAVQTVALENMYVKTGTLTLANVVDIERDACRAVIPKGNLLCEGICSRRSKRGDCAALARWRAHGRREIHRDAQSRFGRGVGIRVA